MESTGILVALFFLVFFASGLVEGGRVKPFCPEDKNVTARLLREGIKDKGRAKRDVQTRWPYDCFYPSIITFQGRPYRIVRIEECCRKCSFPAFRICLIKHKSAWFCLSSGIHCVVNCVNLHDPTSSRSRARSCEKKDGRAKSAGGRTKKRRKSKKRKIGGRKLDPNCYRISKRPGGRCIERLCIPLKFP